MLNQYRTVFVGRENELRQLKDAYDAAASGQGMLAMVTGEPGVGKSALCEQLANYAGACGGLALTGHCYEEGSLTLPYLPFVEAFRSYVVASRPERLRRDLGSGAADVARVVSEVGERLRVRPRPRGDAGEDRWRLYQALIRLARATATDQPLVILLEDLHWADRGSLDFLIHLTRHLVGTRLLLVGTYQDVAVDRMHPLSGALAELRRAAIFVRLPVRGLTAVEVHSMMEQLLERSVPTNFAGAVHRQTEGNPLFVQEVVRHLAEAGAVMPAENRWQRAGDDAQEIYLPEGLREVVGKRLSRLSPACNRLLAIASVIGTNFALQTLEQVAGVEDESMLTSLEEAVRVRVLEEIARAGQIRYRFVHSCFRQALYEEMLAPRRLRLHQQVARVLERAYQFRLEEHAAELAEHHAQSTDHHDLEKAVAYTRMAAEHASTVHAYGESVRLLEQALAIQEIVDPDDNSRRCQLLLALAAASGPAGEAERAVGEVAEEAFRLAEAIGDSTSAAAACRFAFESASRYGSMEAGSRAAREEWAERADRHAAPGSPARVYADLALGLATIGTGTTRSAEGRDRERRALAAARTLGDPRLMFECAAQLLPGRALGNWALALSLAQEVAALPRQGVNSWTTAVALGRCGAVFLACGYRDRAEELWREVSELGERTQDPTIAAHSIMGEIIFATLDGQLTAALAATERFRHVADAAGSSLRGLHLGVAHGMRVYFYLGRAQEALDGLRQWSEATSAQGKIPLGLGLAHAGYPDEARQILDEVIALWRRTAPDGEAATRRVQPLLELAVLLEDRAAVAFLVPLLLPVAQIISSQMDLACVARHLGAAAVLLGDFQGARDHYQQALQVCERVGFRPEIALIRLQQAELELNPVLRGLSRSQREQGRIAALQHLDIAVEELGAMGMQPAQERALALQSTLRRAAPEPFRPAYPGGLSEREVDVLRILAAGKSNRDIADELVISANTAARHVSNIFRKIDAANRVEAASYATRHGLL
jgi:predicted ATPase/DNA-binding CsgD family transcriptional regulator